MPLALTVAQLTLVCQPETSIPFMVARDSRGAAAARITKASKEATLMDLNEIFLKETGSLRKREVVTFALPEQSHLHIFCGLWDCTDSRVSSPPGAERTFYHLAIVSFCSKSRSETRRTFKGKKDSGGFRETCVALPPARVDKV